MNKINDSKNMKISVENPATAHTLDRSCAIVPLRSTTAQNIGYACCENGRTK
jgi:hypothetical protein